MGVYFGDAQPMGFGLFFFHIQVPFFWRFPHVKTPFILPTSLESGVLLVRTSTIMVDPSHEAFAPGCPKSKAPPSGAARGPRRASAGLTAHDKCSLTHAKMAADQFLHAIQGYLLWKDCCYIYGRTKNKGPALRSKVKERQVGPRTALKRAAETALDRESLSPLEWAACEAAGSIESAERRTTASYHALARISTVEA